MGFPLGRMPVGLDGVAAAVRGCPDQGAGLWLGDVPSGCLFDFVVPAAEGGEVAFAGDPALVVGGGVVEVAVFGGAAAAGVGAGAVPDLDQVPQGRAGLVGLALAAVPAVAVF